MQHIYGMSNNIGDSWLSVVSRYSFQFFGKVDSWDKHAQSSGSEGVSDRGGGSNIVDLNFKGGAPGVRGWLQVGRGIQGRVGIARAGRVVDRDLTEGCPGPGPALRVARGVLGAG